MAKVKCKKFELSEEIIKEDKTIIEDLIVAAHNSAKSQLKTKTTEEISKATGGLEFLVLNGRYN
jgi:DNA-binding protein YbaB